MVYFSDCFQIDYTNQKYSSMKQQENQSFSNTIKPPHKHEKVSKHRISINRGFQSLLSDIQQLSRELIPSIPTNLDLYQKVNDAKALDLIKSYRNLDLPCLKNMSQQQCVDRYLNDPFFHKKLQYEFEYLSKVRSNARPPLMSNLSLNDSPKTFNEMKPKNIKFKDVIRQDQKLKLQQKKKYESVLRRVSSHQQFNIGFNI